MQTPVSTPSPARSLWPYAIIGWFTLAITAAIIFVTWAVRQNMDLVQKDYYAEELRFQSQLDRVNRTRDLAGEFRLIIDPAGKTVDLALPSSHAGHPATGKVHFYRPSNARLDRTVALAVDASGQQRIDTHTFASGLWKVRIQWSVNGAEFFVDKALVLPGSRS